MPEHSGININIRAIKSPFNYKLTPRLPSWSTDRWSLFRRWRNVANVIGKYAAIHRFFDQRHPVLLRVGRDNFITFIQRIIIIGRQRQENMAGAVRPRIPR
jgi:hypothetical protein